MDKNLDRVEGGCIVLVILFILIPAVVWWIQLLSVAVDFVHRFLNR